MSFRQVFHFRGATPQQIEKIINAFNQKVYQGKSILHSRPYASEGVCIVGHEKIIVQPNDFMSDDGLDDFDYDQVRPMIEAIASDEELSL